MDALLAPGHDLIVAIQAWRTPALDFLFRCLSFLGEEDFLIALLPALFLVVDKRLTIRLLPLFLVSIWVNSLVKATIGQPRPFDPRIVQLVVAEGFAFPSNHAQAAAVLWGFLAGQSRRRWAPWGSLLLVLGIGFARVYLGVHFLHDVIAGWLIGLALLAGYLVALPSLEAFVRRRSPAEQIIAGLAFAVGLALLFHGGEAMQVTGVLAGAAIGLPLESRFVRFQAHYGLPWQKVARLALGLATVLALRVGLKAVFPEAALFDFVRYLVIGLWVGLGAPWLFVTLRLASPLAGGLGTLRREAAR